MSNSDWCSGIRHFRQLPGQALFVGIARAGHDVLSRIALLYAFFFMPTLVLIIRATIRHFIGKRFRMRTPLNWNYLSPLHNSALFITK
jgi:hypothetical protein